MVELNIVDHLNRDQSKAKREQFLKLLQSVAPVVKPEAKKAAPKKDKIPHKISLKNKTVVFTGALLSMTRKEAEGYLNQLGGSMGPSVTRNVDFIIHPDAGQFTAKTDKAKALGIPSLTESAWLDILKQAGLK